MSKKILAIKKEQFKSEIVKIIEKHGTATVLFVRENNHEHARRRRIKKDGSCDVSYKSESYGHWTSWDESCFMHYCETQDYYSDYHNRWIEKKSRKRKTLRNTIKALVEHDRDDDIIPLVIKYGKGKQIHIVADQKF